MSNIGFAARLAAVRDLAAKDLADALARVKKAGFDFVVWDGMPTMDAEGMRDALQEAELKAIAGQTDLEFLESHFDVAIEHWQTVGVPDLVIPAAASADRAAEESWKRFTERIGLMAARLDEAGFRCCYHHGVDEFLSRAKDDTIFFTHLVEESDPACLNIAFDTLRLARAGVDPAETIRACPDRVPLIYLEDTAREKDEAGGPQPCPIGEGRLDWEKIFDAGEEVGTEWYTCSHAQSGGDPLRELATSLAYLAEHA